MTVSIHVEFMRALGRLSAQDRKVTEDMILRLQSAGVTPGMRRHVVGAGSEPFISLSPNMDLRVLAIESKTGITLLYADHHDKAYQWIERNHKGLRAATAIALAAAESSLSNDSEIPQGISKWGSMLLDAGFPPALTRLVSTASTEEELLDLVQMMAPEWQELVLDAALSGRYRAVPTANSNIWVAPDDGSLRAALALPLSQWRLFLHPSQLEAVRAGSTRDLLVVGGPGTGKTIALVHRALYLARSSQKGQKVLLVGHSPQAVSDMKTMLRELNNGEPRNVEVVDMIAIGRDGKQRLGDLQGPAPGGSGFLRYLGDDVQALLIDESQDVHRTTKSFVFGLRPTIRTHVTAAIDLNQNIFAKNTEDEAYLRFLERADILHLRYSYRIPREVGVFAERVQGVADSSVSRGADATSRITNLSREIFYGFSTDYIKVFAYASIPLGLQHAGEIKQYLEASGARSIAVVFCGNARDRRRYASELRNVGYDPATDTGVLTVRAVKGREFDYCIVIAPELLRGEGETGQVFARNQLYVAVSRCRRGLVVYADRAFVPEIAHPGVEVVGL